jgi:hypothetical protein
MDDQPIKMTRCLEAVTRYGLKADDIWLPDRKQR